MAESTDPWSKTPNSSPSTADARSRLAALLEEQRSQWHGGSTIEVEAYLRDHSFLRGDPEAILDLIYGEIRLRSERRRRARGSMSMSGDSPAWRVPWPINSRCIESGKLADRRPTNACVRGRN